MTAKAAVAEVRSDSARSAQAVPEEFSRLADTDRPQFFGRVIVSRSAAKGRGVDTVDVPKNPHR